MTYHHRQTRRLHPKLVVAAQDSAIPRYIQALYAGFAQSSHLSYLLHTKRRIAVTPLMRQRLERLALLLKFPTNEVFMHEPEREVEL